MLRNYHRYDPTEDSDVALERSNVAALAEVHFGAANRAYRRREDAFVQSVVLHNLTRMYVALSAFFIIVNGTISAVPSLRAHDCLYVCLQLRVTSDTAWVRSGAAASALLWIRSAFA